jgi:hypothetical protein
MAGGSKTTSTTYQSQPGVNDVLGTAKTLFDSGAPWRPDTSSHVTPFSTQTTRGLQGMFNQANDAATRWSFNNSFNNAAQVTRDGGLNDLQDSQVGRLEQIAAGSGLNATQQLALDWLNPIASGQARQDNPYLEDVIRRSSDDIAGSANLQASAAGRYGSGSHQGVLADSIGDMSSKLRYQDYDQQQARQDAAIRDVFGMGSTAQQQRGDAIGSLFNAGREQRQNQLDGSRQLLDAYNARLAPYQTMREVGREYEDLHSRVLGDQARVLQERRNALTDPVNWLAGLAGGYQGGQQVTTQNTRESPFSNPLVNGLLGKIFGL